MLVDYVHCRFDHFSSPIRAIDSSLLPMMRSVMTLFRIEHVFAFFFAFHYHYWIF
jgi:hypothetical protein